MSERDAVRRKVLDSVDTRKIFDETETAIIEWNIDKIVKEARRGKYRRFTVDKAPLRTKYFFGEGYTYGGQLQERGAGNEKLYPKGEVDPIPHWIQDLVIQPLEEAGVVRSGWINSAVVNDYLPGGCIVSHIDPPQLFSRPIITVSFFSDSYLSFGCKFSFKPIRVSSPSALVSVRRGCCLSMSGFAANEITHCIRPEDIRHRRAVIILRNVPDKAPRMSALDMEHFIRVEDRKKRERGRSLSPVRERRLESPDRANNVFILDHRKLGLRERKDQDRHRCRQGRRSRSPRYRGRSRSPVARRRSRSRSRRRSGSRRRRRRTRSRSPPPHRTGTLRTLRGISGVSSRTAERILKRTNTVDRRVTVSKPVQDAILKNILGQYSQDDDDQESSADESVNEAISKITNTEELDQEEEAFQSRLEKMKMKITEHVKKGKYGNIKLEDDKNVSKQEKEKCIESEVETLKNELKELKEHIKNKNEASSSSSCEDTSEEEDESEEEEKEEKKPPISVLDIFKTTILKKTSKTTKSTYLCQDSQKPSLKRSKLIESKTQKILKERIQMRNNIKK